ncbi:MAG: hypothetical protein WBL95_12010 [Microcoleus sp.]
MGQYQSQSIELPSIAVFQHMRYALTNSQFREKKEETETIPDARCYKGPMPDAQCPMPNARCPGSIELPSISQAVNYAKTPDISNNLYPQSSQLSRRCDRQLASTGFSRQL